MEGPPREGRSGALSPLVARILMVATVVALVGTLYALVAGPLATNPQVSPLTVSVAEQGTNWTVTFTRVPGGHLPSDMYLMIRNDTNAIVLARTPFAALTEGNWSLHKVSYVDGDPGIAEVRAGDGLRIELARFPAGSVLEVSDRSALLLIQPLA